MAKMYEAEVFVTDAGDICIVQDRRFDTREIQAVLVSPEQLPILIRWLQAIAGGSEAQPIGFALPGG